MESLFLAIFDLIRGLLSDRVLWGPLVLATALLTLIMLGVAGRVVLWLETMQHHDQA